jgi:hypothetical protein
MAAVTTLEHVKELLAKVPNLPQLIDEAKKPEVRTWAQTAWIYNGFDDITLYHMGFPYELKRGQLTKIEGKPDYKEIDQGKSSGQSIVWQVIPLTGEFIAGELIYEHGFHDMGFTVITKPVIDDAEKARCDETGKIYKLRRIEEFKVNRDKARAGIQGYKINPDPTVYRWLKEYSPDDTLFAETKKTDSNNAIAEAIALLTRLVAGQQTAVPVPAIDTVAGAPEPPAAETVTVDMPTLKRKPLETDEQLKIRTEKWLAEKAKVEANREAGIKWVGSKITNTKEPEQQ